MRRLPPLICLLAFLLLVVPAVGSAAGPAGFSDPVAVGAGSAGQTAGAVSADGRAALAWTARADGEALNVALRDGAGRPWRANGVATSAMEVRDPQVVVTANGDTVVAWAEIADRGRHQAVAVAAAPAGRELGAVRRFAVGDGFSAFPRLSVMRSGAILLAFRDAKRGTPARLRVALRPAASNRFQAPRTVVTGASSLALAATGDGAVMAWATPPPRTGTERTLYALRLDGRGRPRGDKVLVSHAAGAEVRLAGAADDRSIVSWVRPRHSPNRPPALFTRSLAPVMRPARPLVPPAGTIFGGAAALALGLDGRALATATALGGAPTGLRVFVARSAFGGVWTGHQELSGASGSPSVGDPRPVLLVSGEAFAMWSQARTVPGPASYDILVARRAPADASFAPAEALSGAVPASQVGGLLVATGGEHILAAWPAAAGGMLVAERG